MERRKFLIGTGVLLLVFATGQLCPDEEEKSQRRVKRRHKWLKRTGRDKVDEGDGKGWEDDYRD
jgi:hypothetical protein